MWGNRRRVAGRQRRLLSVSASVDRLRHSALPKRYPVAPGLTRSTKSPLGWETGGMVFAADDLGRLVALLAADAARRRLTTLVVGSDQVEERR